ncbi:MAG: glycosyltransferase family 9 protein [Synechococcales bacterium]|nr:glycosyltransferase family 9 protein [Synechococcales bacterium]
MASPSRILFIELLGGLGDVLIALPAMQAIATSHPQPTLTVLTFAPGGDLLRHHPLIDRVIQVPAGSARQAVEQVLQQSQSLGVLDDGVKGNSGNSQGGGITPTGSYDLIVTDTTYDGIADLVAQSPTSRVMTNLWRHPPDDQRVSDRFLQILYQEGLIGLDTLHTQQHPRIYLTAAEQAAVQAQLSHLPRPRVGLYADAGMAIKRWSLDHFIALGRTLQKHYSPISLVVPQGSDATQVQAITAQLPGATPWPRGTLRELAALFAQLDAVVAADTGPARIAAALGIPTITLFGPSWGDRYGQPPPHRNLQGHPPCPERHIANFTTQPCWYSGHCPFEWETCVDEISPEIVFETLKEMLWKAEEKREEGGEKKEERRGKKENSGVRSQESGVGIPDSEKSPNSKIQNPKSERNPKSKIQNPKSKSLPSWPSARNLLAIRLDNIGDVIMTGPALRSLKARPGTRLTLLASPAGALAAPVLPWVDEVIVWRSLWQDLGRLSFDPEREWQLVERLRERRFDAAVIFTSFKQSPHPPAFVCQLADIPLRLGDSREVDGVLTHTSIPLSDTTHQVERNLRLVESVGYEVGDRTLQLAIPPSRLIPETPYLLLNPWTSCPSRTYDLGRFGEAAALLSRQTGYPVVVTGLEKDRDRARPLLAKLGDRALDYIGQTQFSDLVALVAQAQLLLSNNTSTMHIADATRTPSVILFAGTELERQWRPRSTRAILLRRPTPCSPCYQFTCPYDLECLDIAPEAVVEAGLSLLKEVSLCK